MRTITDVAHDLHTQDNRITELPVFVVEQRRRIYGLDTGYTDDVVWIDDEGSEADAEETARLDEHDRCGPELEGWTQTGYRDVWEFVTACFTERGCQDYIDRNRHNLKDPRIYVYSGYRNHEWTAIREHLMQAPRPTVETAAWAREVVEKLRDTKEALEQALAVAKGPAKPRMQRGIDAVDAALEVLAKGAKFTVQTSEES